MFKPRFAALVENGTKLQTVRPRPRRMPKAGDILSLRCWTGSPYRSKQRVLRVATITKVSEIAINKAAILIDGRILALRDEPAFAQADGFATPEEMRAWFRETHGLPFVGIVLYWHNKANEPTTGS